MVLKQCLQLELENLKAKAVEKARENTGATETDVLIGGINQDIQKMASATIENKVLKDQVNNFEKKSSDNIKDMKEKTMKNQ